MKQNIFRTWGLLFGQRGSAGYVIGFLFHQLLAAVIAVLSAVFFGFIGVEGGLTRRGTGVGNLYDLGRACPSRHARPYRSSMQAALIGSPITRLPCGATVVA